MTRSASKAQQLLTTGVLPLVVDVFDVRGLHESIVPLRPTFVIHQLTDLPPGLDPQRMGEAVAANARVRSEGTANLVAVSLAAGARRIVAQSISWAYANGPEPHVESDPLDENATGSRAISVGGVIALEHSVLHSPPLKGVVLRYGQLYGAGTGRENSADLTMPLHVDGAAWAAMLAMQSPHIGIFNIAETDSHVDAHKARALLGWNPAARVDE
jgi:nucleoside-diphosphate-sugar epimerase